MPTKDQATVALEASNLVTARKLLGAASGAVILEDSGTVGGAVSGVGKSARVEDAGPYTLTAACVGASDVHLVIAQDPRIGLAPQDQTIDCATSYSRVVQLQPGSVNVQVLVMRVYSSASATSTGGGVAAVRLTAGG